MKKSLLALIAGTSALALMGTMALAQNVGKLAVVDGSYTLTINASNIVNTSGTYYNVKTPNGSDFELFFGNTKVDGGTINLALNGAGIYFYSPIQHITFVMVDLLAEAIYPSLPIDLSVLLYVFRLLGGASVAAGIVFTIIRAVQMRRGRQ